MFRFLPSGLGLGKSIIAITLEILKKMNHKICSIFKGVIMFLLLGAFFHVKSPALREDINVNSKCIFTILKPVYDSDFRNCNKRRNLRCL